MRARRVLAMLMLGAALAAPAYAADPLAITAIIEIPTGGDVKYERDGQERIFVDRFLSAPVVYPANYGSIEDTLAGDGDPLDVLVYSRRPIMVGARIAVRPVGVLRMVDNGEADEKVIAVPVASVDPGYQAVRSIADLGLGEGDRLMAFFRLYKQDAQGRTPVSLSGIGDAAEAAALVRKAQARAGRQ